ncbi:cation diffusion facilitator family transporter [Rhodotorula paludigena]|uniref:cation diffusion facilitator family transporter n=1 Tax=Rhodotorula paludigena TaxID=86838 RepID=UPI00317968B7
MSIPAASHPLETPSKASSDSLPTPPRSPAREHVPVIGAPAPLDHARLGDVEGAVTSPGLDVGGSYFPALTPTTSHDPLLLRDRLQTPETLSDLRRRKNKSHAFYTRQNSHIDSLLKHLDEHVREAEEEEDASRLAIKIAIYGSLFCNCILAVLQLYAAISSLSLSIFGTAIDSVFDPAANLILWWCHRQSDRVDLMKYPSGGSKFESIGDIVYSGIMGAVSVILVAFSVQDLARHNTDKELHIPALIVVGIAFATKFALFAYCFSIRGKNSQVRVLWEDHRNDLFINGFGLFTSAAGAKIAWWIDPAGAMVISFFLIYSWSRTCAAHFRQLAGQAAPMEFQNLITYKAMTFAEQIEAIDSCVAYHNGPRYVVEVDLVMKGDTPLRVAHDVSQALQDKIEELPQVDRAFVHVDHETSHKPEHRKTK